MRSKKIKEIHLNKNRDMRVKD